jgi:hypothetical protein
VFRLFTPRFYRSLCCSIIRLIRSVLGIYSRVLLESVLLNHSSYSRVLLESAAESFVLLPGFIGVCAAESFVLLPGFIGICAAESFVLLPGFIGVCAAQSFVLYVVFWVFTPVFYWSLCCSFIRLMRSILGI